VSATSASVSGSTIYKGREIAEKIRDIGEDPGQLELIPTKPDGEILKYMFRPNKTQDKTKMTPAYVKDKCILYCQDKVLYCQTAVSKAVT